MGCENAYIMLMDGLPDYPMPHLLRREALLPLKLLVHQCGEPHELMLVLELISPRIVWIEKLWLRW